jgi:hypothetical protein
MRLIIQGLAVVARRGRMVLVKQGRQDRALVILGALAAAGLMAGAIPPDLSRLALLEARADLIRRAAVVAPVVPVELLQLPEARGRMEEAEAAEVALALVPIPPALAVVAVPVMSIGTERTAQAEVVAAAAE